MADNIKELININMKEWKVNLYFGDTLLGNENMEWVVLQRVTLSLLAFVLCSISFILIVMKAKAVYEIRNSKVKLNRGWSEAF